MPFTLPGKTLSIGPAETTQTASSTSHQHRQQSQPPHGSIHPAGALTAKPKFQKQVRQSR
jgi:hypothetical protein